MRKCLTIGLSILLGTAVNAQIFSEDFGTDATCADPDTASQFLTGTGAWTVEYGTSYNDTLNNWLISSREGFTAIDNCGDQCLTNSTLSNRTLHIGTYANPGDVGATYDNNTVTDVIVWTPPINTTTVTGTMKLSFDYLEGASADSADNGTVWIRVGTGTPIMLIDPDTTDGPPCVGLGMWKNIEMYIDTLYNNQFQVYIGFKWESDGDGVGGAPSFAIDNLEINDEAPEAYALVDPAKICDATTTNFADSSAGQPTSWFWDFGSAATPSTSTAQNPNNILFNGVGIYTVTLTSTNGAGSNSNTVDVEVINCLPPVPAIASSDSTLCQGQCINFADSSDDGSFGTGQWFWQFQGGTPNTSTAQHPQNICYSASGLYNVTLTVVDTVSGASATDTFFNFIDVGSCSVPNASIEILSSDTTTICNNDLITFVSTSTGEPDIITWTFPGGNPATVTAPNDSIDTIQVLYTTPGTWDVILTVSNGAGTSTDTLHDYVTVLNCPEPKAKFDVSSRTICPGVAVVFQDISKYATEWYWEFPGAEPSTSTDQNPTDILYPTPGSYPVTLIVKNVNGEDTLIRQSYIKVDSCLPPGPRFEVERDSICRSTCVQFTNTSLRTDSLFWIFWWHPFPDSINEENPALDTIDNTTPGYSWLTGDTHFVVYEDFFPIFDTVFMEQDPIYCWDDSGTVGVQLFTYNQYDVSVLNYQDVPVLNIGGVHPELDAGPDKEVVIDNIESRFFLEDTTSFEAEGTAPYYQWYPEEGLSCYDCKNPIIYPTETRKYYLTNFDDYGCQVYDSVAVYVTESYHFGIPNIFSPNGDDNNDILWVRGNAISSEGFKMKIWNRYGQLVFESNNQNDGWDGTYKDAPAPTGSYKYYVKVIFEDGFEDELTGNVTLVRY